jgi:hydrogenase maturation protease
MTHTDHILVIGYGNTLRSDDGVGPRVAEAVDAMGLPGVCTMTCQQLSPEHAAPIAQADRVIFVDASVETSRDVQVRELTPGKTTQLMAHAADPHTMLALARDVFGHAPRAWWLTIPAHELGFGESLSAETQCGFKTALNEIKSLALS